MHVNRRSISALTLAMAMFATACATVEVILPRFFDSGYPVIDWVAISQFIVVGLTWLSLLISAVRPSPVSLIALAITLALCGLILAPVIIVAVMYRAWLVVVLAIGCPVAFFASTRAVIEWRGARI